MREPDTEPLETTELRWFADGSLPGDVESWFTRAGTVGTVEERADTYRVGGRSAVGIKRRAGTTLELKVRQRIDDRLVLGEGLAGPTEVWRKWTPVTRAALNGRDLPWIAVRKRIVKRLFSTGGVERPFSYEARVAMAVGCDVELADVRVDGVHAWTLAFAAFGPQSTRRDAILDCWSALCRDGPLPEVLAERFTTSANYPLWLDLFVGQVGVPE